jgi:Bacterial Ig-like domain (group 3)/FG-GAP-like repeat
LRRFSVSLVFIFIVANLTAETFPNPRFIPAKGNPYGVHVADLNNDGRPDIYFSSRNYGDPFGTPAAIYVLLSQPDGSYSQLAPYTLPATATGDCAALDVNHDLNIDLVCSSGTSASNGSSQYSTQTLLGKGDGTFLPSIASLIGSGQYFHSIGIADFNGDGNADLAVSYVTAYGELANAILLSDGTGHFSSLNGPGIGQYFTVADANNDGKPDILDPTGPASFINNGNGTFNNLSNGTLSYYGCIFQDMDADSKIDAICLSFDTPAGINIIRGNGDGTFDVAHSVYAATPLASDFGLPLKVSDLNHDGILDIVAYSSGGLAVFLGKGNLQFSDPVHYNLTGNNIQATSSDLYAFADLNGDGNLDIVAAGINGIYITYGRSDGTFDAVVNRTLGTNSIYAAMVADFDGDGVPDVVTTDNVNLGISKGKSDGSLADLTQIPAGNISFTGSPSLIHGDFNGDGKQDIIVAGSASGEFNDYLINGNGDGTFTSPVIIPYSSSLGVALDSNTSVGDLNNDGRDDLIRADNSFIYSRLSQPDGSFSAPIKSSIPSDFSLNFAIFALADFDHDGKIDIAYVLQNLWVQLGKGDGTFSPPTGAIQVSGPSAYFIPTDVKVGDFDGDGNPDIAVIYANNSASSNIAIYYGDGTGKFSAPVIVTTLKNVYSYMRVADLDGDGRSDLILGNPSTYLDDFGVTVIHALDNRTFGSETSYVTGSNFRSLLFPADFNRDGFPDLLIGDDLNAMTMLINNPGPVVTRQLTVQPEPSAIGQAFTLTATLGPPPGSTQIPTGTITYSIDRVPVGTANLSNGTASLMLGSALSLGTHQISAYWPGDSNYPSIIFHTTHTVAKIPVTVDLNAQPNPATVGQNVTLTFSFANAVTSPSFSATGTYTVLDGTETIGTGAITASNNTFTLSGPFSPARTHTFTVNYSGDTNHASSTSTLSEIINAAPSTTSLATSANPASYGQAITFTATINPTVAAGVPEFSSSGTSSVTFSGLPGGPITLPVVFPAGSPANTPAVVSYTTTAKIVPGSYPMTVTFSGNTNLLASSSPSVTQIVNPPPSTTSLAVSPVPAFQAHLVTLTATANGVITTPTGTVQFLDGTALLTSSPITAGSVSFSTRLLNVGTHSITAVYSGDNNNAPSISQATTETIQPYDFSLTAPGTTVSLTKGINSATVILTAVSIGGFAEGVDMTITGLPASVSGSISPARLQLTPGNSATTTLTLSATNLSSIHSGGWRYLTGMSLALIMLPLSLLRSRGRLPSLLAAILCFMVLATLSGCGDHSATSTETYNLQITSVGSDTPLTHTITLPLTITR